MLRNRTTLAYLVATVLLACMGACSRAPYLCQIERTGANVRTTTGEWEQLLNGSCGYSGVSDTPPFVREFGDGWLGVIWKGTSTRVALALSRVGSLELHAATELPHDLHSPQILRVSQAGRDIWIVSGRTCGEETCPTVALFYEHLDRNFIAIEWHDGNTPRQLVIGTHQTGLERAAQCSSACDVSFEGRFGLNDDNQLILLESVSVKERAANGTERVVHEATRARPIVLGTNTAQTNTPTLLDTVLPTRPPAAN